MNISIYNKYTKKSQSKISRIYHILRTRYLSNISCVDNKRLDVVIIELYNSDRLFYFIYSNTNDVFKNVLKASKSCIVAE